MPESPSSRRKPGPILTLLLPFSGSFEVKVKMDPGFRRDDGDDFGDGDGDDFGDRDRDRDGDDCGDGDGNGDDCGNGVGDKARAP